MYKQIIPKTKIDDLILPNKTRSLLNEISSQMKKQRKDFREEGFNGDNNENLGLNVLFLGVNNRKKIMVAEALATELHMPLYKINLLQVVNKYVGETEKNLKRLFDMAEISDTILFFALFFLFFSG